MKPFAQLLIASVLCLSCAPLAAAQHDSSHAKVVLPPDKGPGVGPGARPTLKRRADGPTPISGEKVSHVPTPFLETKVMSDVSDYSHNAHRQREQGGSYLLLGGFRWIIEIEERPIVWPRLALWTTSDS
jgi:hypothetical protein